MRTCVKKWGTDWINVSVVKSIYCFYRWPRFGSQQNTLKEVLSNPVTSFDYIRQAEWGMWPDFYTCLPFSKHTYSRRNWIKCRKDSPGKSMSYTGWQVTQWPQTTSAGFGGFLHFYGAGVKSSHCGCDRDHPCGPFKRFLGRNIWKGRSGLPGFRRRKGYLIPTLMPTTS